MMTESIDSKTRFWLSEVKDALGGSELSETTREELLLGCRLGGYRIGELLGVGSAGVVFEATSDSGEELAVKVMMKPSDDDPRSFSLFKREVGIGRALHHPCVLRTFEAQECGNARFLFMERVRGKTLRDVMTKPLPVGSFLTLFRPLAEGLQAAHFEGVVHRDLKPENVMISDKGDVKILDFGLARWSRHESMTVTNQFKGTIRYCAPEQVTDSKNVDHRCDQFAFGLISFEALTGEFPYEDNAENPMLNLMGRMNQPARRLREVAPQFSSQTESVLDKMLNTDADRRYGDVSLAFASLAHSLQA